MLLHFYGDDCFKKTKCQCAQKFNWKMHLENVFEKENGFFSPLSPLGLLGPVSQPPRPLSLSGAAAQPAFLPLSPLSHRQAGPACQFLPPPPQLLSLSLSRRQSRKSHPRSPRSPPDAPRLGCFEEPCARAVSLLPHLTLPCLCHCSRAQRTAAGAPPSAASRPDALSHPLRFRRIGELPLLLRNLLGQFLGARVLPSPLAMFAGELHGRRPWSVPLGRPPAAQRMGMNSPRPPLSRGSFG
jgi:hypothetical protein